MEAMGMVLIALLALWLTVRPGGFGSALPLLGALAVSAQKLLPMLQQLYQNWTNFKGNNRSILDVLDLLDQPLPEHLTHTSLPPLPFTRELRLDGVGFRYRPDTAWVLEDVHLSVPKGSRVGIIGTTGSGKSTLIDVVMGLLLPGRGQMQVDDVEISPVNNLAWQAHIAHVPQAIFLADASIAENIAFGVPASKIDMARMGVNQRRLGTVGTTNGVPSASGTEWRQMMECKRERRSCSNTSPLSMTR
jgi:ATP-binding cassette subfamily B protein